MTSDKITVDELTEDGQVVATRGEDGLTLRASHLLEDVEDDGLLVAILMPGLPLDLFIAFGSLKATGWEFYFHPSEAPGEAARLKAHRVKRATARKVES